ncbi:unnamed protein product [Thelazia callipaeda]|uniref:WD repeat domain phosphoinositide-interacting protein 2 n=1 Tax=Thelazia callipaeda TaxID=103827 RepID=A0A0N5D7Y2_THECL|nr:unnamed protein product [Thelazia callipaeda]
MSVEDEAPPDDLSFIGFNQDATSLAVGGIFGYRLYSTKRIEKFDVVYENYTNISLEKTRNIVHLVFAELFSIIHIERLFSSSLLMIVSTQAPRKLRIYHFQKNNEICAQSYTNTVLAVKVNRDVRFKYMVVCLENIIYIHTVKDMKVSFLVSSFSRFDRVCNKFFIICIKLACVSSFAKADVFPVIHTIRDTPLNASGVIDLSSTVNSYLAYPGSVSSGHVQLFDVSRLSSMSAIAAHTSPLGALRFSFDSKMLATASVRGTVIRVFSTESGNRLYEFTRGIKRFVTIYSLAFSMDGDYLCSSSNTETVHVFKLEKAVDAQNPNEGEEGWVDYLSKQASSYLPTHMNDFLMRGKSFVIAKLPAVGKRNATALPVINGKLHLLVATTDGIAYVYEVEPEVAELTLLRQHKINFKV